MRKPYPGKNLPLIKIRCLGPKLGCHELAQTAQFWKSMTSISKGKAYEVIWNSDPIRLLWNRMKVLPFPGDNKLKKNKKNPKLKPYCWHVGTKYLRSFVQPVFVEEPFYSLLFVSSLSALTGIQGREGSGVTKEVLCYSWWSTHLRWGPWKIPKRYRLTHMAWALVIKL